MTTHPAAARVESPMKKRHPVELWLVRGGIALLVLLVAVQAHARFGYQMTLNKLQARLAAEEETAVPLLVSEVNGLVVGFPSQTEEIDRHWRRRTYSWRGLTQSYRISMPYDSSETKPVVMSLVTANPPPVPEPSVRSESETTPSAPPMPMPGGSAMGGPGGRPQRPATEGNPPAEETKPAGASAEEKPVDATSVTTPVQ